MAKHNVQILIKARDEASKKLLRIGDQAYAFIQAAEYKKKSGTFRWQVIK